MKEENHKYGSCSINIASTNKKKKRDGRNMFLEGREPEPGMTIQVVKQ